MLQKDSVWQIISRRQRSSISLLLTRGTQTPKFALTNIPLKTVENFCYLGNTLSCSTTIDEISQHLSKASSSFGRLRQRLWDEHGIWLHTKIDVYKVVVLITHLYGCEIWTTYSCHNKLLEQFQQCCLRSFCGIKWQDKVSNFEVLEWCDVPSVESKVIKAQLRWAGHITWMEDLRIPKAVFYSQLRSGKRSVGPWLRYKDTLKQHLKACGIPLNIWEASTQECVQWHNTYYKGISRFETDRTMCISEKRARKKAPPVAIDAIYMCGNCGRVCCSKIGLLSHEQTHR